MRALRGSIGRIGPSGGTTGAGDADADPPVAAEAVGVAGVDAARVVPGVFRVGAAAGCDVLVVGGTAGTGVDD
jgi:hypothetical protein